MSLFQVSKSMKALFLGFFCCLGVVMAKDGEPQKASPVQLFSLNAVHPNSDQLVQGIEEGSGQTPPGYRLCHFPILDAGKKVSSRPLLVSVRNIVTSEDIQVARATANHGEIAILLSAAGGKRVSDATSKMEIGRDRMAVILEGEGLIAPTVQAALGREFVISGLSDKQEVERVVLAFNAPIKSSK